MVSKNPVLFFLILIPIITIIGCNKSQKKEKSPSGTEHLSLEDQSDIAIIGYPIQPIDIRQVKLNDAFWLPLIKRIQEKTIAYAIEKCVEEGRLENFLIAGGKMEGAVRGEMPFDDTDVYKVIEGASNSLITAPDLKLSSLLDSLIAIIAVGQEPDGYLTTWRTIDPGAPPAEWVKVEKPKRWDYLYMSHELYNAGHLYEAAYTHYKATGKPNFLDVALKNADLIVKTFGEGEGKIGAVPGHEIIETGLIKLYLVTGKQEYLEMARYFLDSRGNPDTHKLFGSYAQDHLPVTEQEELVGHAVRAVYLYAAMVDIAAIYKDSAYLEASKRLWRNMVEKKMYITGGIGALRDGEAFGANYELPNLTAYSETCAAIGNVYWNHRLHSLTGEADYFDIIERTLYNGLISGISLDGTRFFYPNPLASDGEYNFNKGACTRQSWFDCSCCPTNLIRFLPSMPGLIYSKQQDTVYINLYAGNNATINLNTIPVRVAQSTDYPWNGNVVIDIHPRQVHTFTVKLRIPYWLKGKVTAGDLYQYTNTSIPQATVQLNERIITPSEKDGYWIITRDWMPGDQIQLNLPMTVKQVVANQLVKENQGKVALEYGPIVYAVESIDNPDTFDDIAISLDEAIRVKWQADLLNGVNVLQNDQLTAIPYYSWSNRGVNKMKVWLDRK